MKVVKILGVAIAIYAGLVMVMEGLIGYAQPDMDGGVRITTTDAAGNRTDRTLAGFRLDGNLYVASNHWFRGWYNQALQHPDVEVIVKGQRGKYTAVAPEGSELARLTDEYRMGFVLRMICGFAPSRFLRLDPM